MHLLAYDGSPSRTSIGAGTDPIVVVRFTVRDTVPSDTAYISVSDALAASESLTPVPIAQSTIAVPLDAVTGTLVSMFTATPMDGEHVRVQWEISLSSLAVNVYRSFIDDVQWTKINGDPISGLGQHVLVDTVGERPGTLVYELVTAGVSGQGSIGRLELPWGDVPVRFALYQNAPNPFTSLTLIRFDVPRKAHVRIVLYDIAGRQLRVLQDQELTAGRYSRSWDGRGARGEPLSNGIYFLLGELGSERIVRKVTRIR
jgi:hypothetical protein